MAAPVLQRFAVNFWAVTVSKVLYRLVSIGVAMYLARALGAAVLGQYATVMNVLTLFLAFSDLGVTNLVIRDVSQDRALAASYLDNFFALQLGVGVLLIGLIMLTGVLAGYEPLVLTALAIGSVGPFFSGLSNAYEGLMNAHELFYPFAVIEMICMLLFLAGNLAVVLMGGGLLALVGVTAMVSFSRWMLGTGWARRFDMRVRWRFAWDAVRMLLKAGLPFLLINGTHFAIQRMDVLFLSWSVAEERVGMYAAASRLIFASLFVLASVGVLLYPVLSRLFVEDRERAGKLTARGTLFLFLLALLLAQLFATAAPVIVTILYGEAYIESAAILQLLALFLPLFGIGLLASNVLMVTAGVWKAVRASMTGLFVGIVLSPLLIDAFEIRGAAFAVLVAEAVAAALFIWFARRDLRLQMRWRALVAGTAAFALPPPVLILFGVPEGFLLTVLSTTLSVPLLFVFRVLTAHDVREIVTHVGLRRREG
ncbi:MAG: oligosaccharide flippase family protein [Bacteroidetes bacterium]|nr:oligosaccharide flippase family protein [Bacteroidota bacterium]